MPTLRLSGRGPLILAVFYANLVSLAAQMVWVRKVNLLFGATAGVFASVLAVVLAGLACGAAWSGRRAAAEARPERLLAGLLITLGALCVVSLPVLAALRGLFLAVAPVDLSAVGRAALRLPVIAAVLLPPTFVIGAVLPLATHLYSRASTGAVAALYAADTLGAAVGALVGGFVLVPWLGLTASSWVLGLGAVGVAVLVARTGALPSGAAARTAAPPTAVRKKKQSRGKGRSAAAPRKVAAHELGRRARMAVLVAAFLTGSAALLLETGWNRFFYLLNGTNIFSLSTVVAGFLTGIGLGSAAVRRRLERGGDLWILIAFLQVAVALGGLLVFRARETFERVYLALFEETSTFGGFQLGVYLMVFGLVALATLSMGASFPAIVRLLAPRSEGEARTLGMLYFINTAGAVTGALAGELLLLPRVGFDGLLAVVTAIYLGSAALFWSLAPAPARRRALLPLAALAAAAVLWAPPVRPFAPPFNALYYSGVRQGSYAKYLELNAAHQVLLQRQGFYGQVSVSRTPNGDLYLKNNGKTDASTNERDNFAQNLLGHVPLLIHPRPQRVLNIGLGGGLTLSSITAHSEPREIVLVELDPLVVDATRDWFSEANRHALDDPRVSVVVDDGRSYVERAPGKFDVIVSEPPNIWVSGVSGLFTREFYGAVREHLRPGGILCQWLPLYELSEGDFATALATMSTELRHFAGWTNGSVALIVASADPLPLADTGRWRRLAPDVLADLENAGVRPGRLADFLGQPDIDAATIARLRGRARGLNLDDRPVLEFGSARNLYRFNKPGGGAGWARRLQKAR